MARLESAVRAGLCNRAAATAPAWVRAWLAAVESPVQGGGGVAGARGAPLVPRRAPAGAVRAANIRQHSPTFDLTLDSRSSSAPGGHVAATRRSHMRAECAPASSWVLMDTERGNAGPPHLLAARTPSGAHLPAAGATRRPACRTPRLPTKSRRHNHEPSHQSLGLPRRRLDHAASLPPASE